MYKLIVTYDIANENDRQKVNDRLHDFPVCLDINDSCYYIKTSNEPVRVRDILLQFCNSDTDSIFVAEITGFCAWRKIKCGSSAFKSKV